MSTKIQSSSPSQASSSKQEQTKMSDHNPYMSQCCFEIEDLKKDGLNYVAWKTCSMQILRTQKLDSVVTRTNPKPSPGAAANEAKDWECYVYRVFSPNQYIFINMEKSELIYIHEETCYWTRITCGLRLFSLKNPLVTFPKQARRRNQ
jgi:hypothetical protein